MKSGLAFWTNRLLSVALPLAGPGHYTASTSSAILYASTAGTALVLVCLSYHSKWKTNGYLPGFCSALSCALMNNYVHCAHHEEGLPFGLCMVARTSCLSMATAALGKMQSTPVQFYPDRVDVRVLVATRAIAGVICTGSLFVAFSYAPVLQCLAVYYSNSIFSALIASFFLNETLQCAEWMSMLVGVSAVLAILYSSAHGAASEADAQPLVGLSFAALAALAEAIAGVANRSLKNKVHHLSLMFAQAATGFAIFALLSLKFPEHFYPEILPLKPSQSRVLAGVVLSSFMVQLTLSQAYMLEKTGPLQVFVNATVVVPQLVFDAAMGHQYNAATWIGLALLAVYLFLSWRAQQSSDDTSLQRDKQTA